MSASLGQNAWADASDLGQLTKRTAQVWTVKQLQRGGELHSKKVVGSTSCSRQATEGSPAGHCVCWLSRLQSGLGCLTMQALLRCHMNDQAWQAGRRWTQSYLQNTVVSHSCTQTLPGTHLVLVVHSCCWTAQGRCWVAVKHRQQAREGNGRGGKVHMTLNVFLVEMAAGGDSTTSAPKRCRHKRSPLLGCQLSVVPRRPACQETWQQCVMQQLDASR